MRRESHDHDEHTQACANLIKWKMELERVNVEDEDELEASLDDIIDYHKAFVKPNMRSSLRVAMSNPTVTFVFHLLNSIISFILLIQRIVFTYNHQNPIDHWVWQVTVHVVLLLDYMLRLYVDKDFLHYLMSMDSIVNLLTTVPYLLAFAAKPDELNVPVLIVHHLDILRLKFCEKILLYIESELPRELGKIVLDVSLFIIGVTMLMHTIFNVDKEFVYCSTISFDRSFFFIMITIGIIGYYSECDTIVSRIVITFVIILAIVIIPPKCSSLMALLSSKLVYTRRSYHKIKSVSHIIITGSVSTTSAQDVLTELFHEDHGIGETHAVILSPEMPDFLMESLLNSPEHRSTVFYIQGNPLSERDLKRCQAEKAAGVLILCNKQSADPTKEDAKTLLRAIVIKRFLKAHNNLSVRVCIQLLKPESISQYHLSLKKDAKFDHIICVEAIKLSLLAKSCLCPGLVVMIAGLISSKSASQAAIHDAYLEDYWNCQGYEIYRIEIPQQLRGLRFNKVAIDLYKKHRTILFALEVALTRGKPCRRAKRPRNWWSSPIPEMSSFQTCPSSAGTSSLRAAASLTRS
jgi:hypothetical protein